MKNLEFKLKAETEEEMIQKLEATLDFVKHKKIDMKKMGMVDEPEVEEEEEMEDCPACQKCKELKDKMEDLQRCIGCMVYYDLPISVPLVEEYNNSIEEFVNCYCPGINEEEDD